MFFRLSTICRFLLSFLIFFLNIVGVQLWPNWYFNSPYLRQKTGIHVKYRHTFLPEKKPFFFKLIMFDLLIIKKYKNKHFRRKPGMFKIYNNDTLSLIGVCQDYKTPFRQKLKLSHRQYLSILSWIRIFTNLSV